MNKASCAIGLGLLMLSILLVSCSKAPEHAVAGAEYFEEFNEAEAINYGVLEFPLTQTELDYYLSSIDRVVSAGDVYPNLWDEVGNSDAPMVVLKSHPLWEEAKVEAASFLAAFVKLNFLQEHMLDPISPAEAKADVVRLMQMRDPAKPDAELENVIQTMETMAKHLESMTDAGSISLYTRNQSAIDLALEKFRGIGESELSEAQL